MFFISTVDLIHTIDVLIAEYEKKIAYLTERNRLLEDSTSMRKSWESLPSHISEIPQSALYDQLKTENE